MCGSARSITSPSISRTSRSTPCAAGCCGPKFNVRFLISATQYLTVHRSGCRLLRPAVRFLGVIFFAHDARRNFPRLDGHGLIYDPLLVGVVAHFHISGNWEVFTKGMTDKTVVGENAPQIG